MRTLQPLVLVADNDDAVRDALQFALQLEDFEVHVHQNGQDLLADGDLRRADCLILKEHMPGLDGLEVMRHVRARNYDLPAILLTANTCARLQERAAALGVRQVLEKPLLDNVLLDGLLGILQPASSREVLHA